MRTVKVPLHERSYDIRIGTGLIKQLGHDCSKLAIGTRCAVFTDSHVGPRFAKHAIESLNQAGIETVQVRVPAGEGSKSLAKMQHCYEQLAKHHIDRKCFIVALGGGVIGDLAGFVAATWLRGIPFVQVPTTLLAQVDSSVGGKTGVNLKAGKNLVGAFHQPRLVLCDLDTLKTLPEREFKSGLAEIIKYGIIFDAALFEFLERRLFLILARDPATLTRVIARCCSIKAEVVGKDETESGLRAILNFGHTVGHAIEAISQYGKYLHGEAISIGQAAAAKISAQVQGLPREDATRIIALFEKAGLPVKIKLDRTARTNLMKAMTLDKKASGGKVKFVLAKKIGAVDFGCTVPENIVAKTIAGL